MASVNPFQANNTFDPYSQHFTLLAPDGQTQVTGKMANILALQANATVQGIIYGIQTGLSALLLFTLLLMTKSDKRRSAVFLLNVAALLLVLMRNIVNCVELVSIFYNFYNWELHWYPAGSALRHAMGASITAEILSLLTDAVIYASLVLQVYIVCCTLHRYQQLLILFGGTFIAVVSVSVRMTLAVMNIKWFVLGIDKSQVWQLEVFVHLASANNIITVVSIAIYSLVFVVKLAFAIRLRRKLHMKQFGPMQIIFVMGCQTLAVPLIFAIIAYYVAPGAQLSSFVATIVAVFLPLSGMWASVSSNQRTAPNESNRVIPVGGSGPANGKAYCTLSGGSGSGSGSGSGTNDTITTQTSTLVDDRELFGSVGDGSFRGRSRSESDDVEMQQARQAAVIDVSRTFSIRSD